MNKQEILQLKVLALNAVAGDQIRATQVYDWLRQPTDDAGTPVPTPVVEVPQAIV